MNTKVVNVVKCFGCNHELWTNDKEVNRRVVEFILNKCYWKFEARRFLFLNEVYKELDIPMTRQGQVAGWIYNRDHADDHMWTVWTKDDEYADVYITFEPIEDITHILPEE